jgi:PII-like signaling protein
MSEPCLKLTAYFAERQRAVGQAGQGGRFLADSMLDLFGASDVATSVMLRGIASFGASHELRTDVSLSLSEDPAVAVAAVDVEPKIRSLVDDVAAMTSSGLLTLERARLVTPQLGAGALSDFDGHNGDAAKLTVYVGRQERVAGKVAHYAICDLLHRNRFAGAIVLLGVDGTAHGERYRARFFGRNVNVPVMIIAIGSTAQVSAAASELSTMMPNPLLTIERVRLCKRDGELFARPQELPTTDEQGRTLWQKLMVYTAEGTRQERLPIHRALVQRLLRSGTARGATVLRGIWGFYGDHKPHGDKLFQLGRGVPVTTIIVDTPASIARSFDIVDELTARHGLVTSEMVPAALSLDETPGGLGKLGDITLAQHDY